MEDRVIHDNMDVLGRPQGSYPKIFVLISLFEVFQEWESKKGGNWRTFRFPDWRLEGQGHHWCQVWSCCQKSRSYMDDDLSICRDGKNVGVRHECQCAGALKSAKCTEWPAACRLASPQRIFSCWAIILLTVDPSRGLRSEISSILVNIVQFMLKVTYLVAYI